MPRSLGWRAGGFKAVSNPPEHNISSSASKLLASRLGEETGPIVECAVNVVQQILRQRHIDPNGARTLTRRLDKETNSALVDGVPQDGTSVLGSGSGGRSSTIPSICRANASVALHWPPPGSFRR